MICWFETGLTNSFGGLEPLTDGLGFSPVPRARTTTENLVAADDITS